MAAHRLLLLAVACACVVGPAFCQDAEEDPEFAAAVAEAEAEQPCIVDAQLSLWLSLEAADRMIAALEEERRDLASELATTLKGLDVLARADDPEGVNIAELGTLVAAKAIGQAALSDTWAGLQDRLVRIEKTLQRRYRQQATLEALVEATYP